MSATIVHLPALMLVGYQLETNLKEFNAGLGKQTIQALLTKKDDVGNQATGHIILLQRYPMTPGFDPWVDRYTQFIGYEVSAATEAPAGMAVTEVPDSKYVSFTHKGLESEMQRSYDYLYGVWMQETGSMPKGYDFEIWDERYRPESIDNEIPIHIAIH